MFERSHWPPPSATGTMWSASQSDFRLRSRSFHCLRNCRRAAKSSLRISRRNTIVSTPHLAHTPRSRANTLSLRYPGSVRNFHSCTQASEQNVLRPFGTSCLHHLHSGRPEGPRSSAEGDAHPPALVRVGFAVKQLSFHMSPAECRCFSCDRTS